MDWLLLMLLLLTLLPLVQVFQRATRATNWLSLIGAGLERLPQRVCVANYPFLTQLYLGHNRLRALPDHLCFVETLRGLYVQCNQLERLPADLGRLTELQELYVSDNRISVLPSSMTRLTALSCVWTDENPLPMSLSRNVSRNGAEAQRFLATVGAYYGPLHANARRAALCFLWLCAEMDSDLPAELRFRIAQSVWQSRKDESLWGW